MEEEEEFSFPNDDFFSEDLQKSKEKTIRNDTNSTVCIVEPKWFLNAGNLPSHISPKEMRIHQARFYFSKGMYQEVINCLLQEVDKMHKDERDFIARSYIALEEHEKALNFLLINLKEKQFDFITYELIGSVLHSMGGDRINDAIFCYSQSLTFEWANANTWIHLSQCIISLLDNQRKSFELQQIKQDDANVQTEQKNLLVEEILCLLIAYLCALQSRILVDDEYIQRIQMHKHSKPKIFILSSKHKQNKHEDNIEQIDMSKNNINSKDNKSDEQETDQIFNFVDRKTTSFKKQAQQLYQKQRVQADAVMNEVRIQFNNQIPIQDHQNNDFISSLSEQLFEFLDQEKKREVEEGMKKGREEPGKDKSHAFAAISLDNQAQQLNKQSSSSSQSTSQDIDPYLVRFLIVPHSLSNYISRPFIAYLPCRNVFDRTIIWLHQQIHTFLKEDKLDNKNESNFTPNSSSQSEQLSLSLFSWFIALWLRVHKNGFSQGYLSIRLTDEMINQYKQYSDKEDLDMGLGGDEEDEEDIDGIIGQNDDAQDFDFDSLEEKKENADFPGIPLNKL